MRYFYIVLCSLLLSCIFVIGHNNVSFAASMWTNIEIKNGINNIDIVKAVIEKFNVHVDSYTGNNLTKYNTMLEQVENTDAYMALYLSSGTNGPFLNLSLYKKDDSTLNAYCVDTGFRIDHVSANKRLQYSSGWDQYNRYNNTLYNFNNSAINNSTYFSQNQCVYAFGFNMQGQYFEYNSLNDFSASNLTNVKYVDRYNRIVNINNIDYFNPEYSRSVKRWYVGSIVGAENVYNIKVYYEMYNNNDWISQGELQAVPVTSDNHLEVYFYGPTTLYNQAYRLYFINNEERDENYYYYYFTPFGTAATSGDSPVYTGNDNNNNVLENQQQQENQDFWKNTYNAMFNMNSGDLNELYQLTASYFPSGETPISIYETIFGGLNNSPDDFIIRWDDHPLVITWKNGEILYSGDFIKANSINISQTVRDNLVLSLIKFYINLFVVIGFLMTYYFTLYKCFCHILGVISEVYEPDNDNYKRDDIGFKM